MPTLFPTDTREIVECCHTCGDSVYRGHPHKRHHTCADCGEPCPYYGPFGTTNGRDFVCEDCLDWEGATA